jgi:para-nitrobenzyl esterase
MRIGSKVKCRLARVGVTGTALVALLACAALGVGCGERSLEQVQLDSGPVVGALEAVDGEDVWTFAGIPYAEPPVGELRWQPPQPVEPWTTPRVCTEVGPACPQPAMFGVFSISGGRTDEDCLYLNVWSPAETQGERLPVMVWIHGGSFETGSGSFAVYSGRHLAAEGVVVVTINYRLGVLGFLSHPALSARSAGGASGNYGLLDQIAALEWVQANIAGFGGDPGNVTVFGESAGGMSILDLMVSPPAEGLFKRAIVQSGILLDQGFGVQMVEDREQAEARGEAFAERLGVDPSGDVAAQMRAKSTDELLAAAADLAADTDSLGQIVLWKPVVDGYVLPGMPTELWATGEHRNVDLLIGSNADEAEIFLAGTTVSRARYEAQMRTMFGDYADEALALYPGNGLGGARQALSRALTEVGFASSARFAARMMSGGASDDVDGGAASGAPGAPSVYLYEFTRAPLFNPLGAFHAVELPYVFGTFDLLDGGLGFVQPADRELSETMMGYWTRFAATGDPNGEGAPEWPRYEAASDLHLELGDTITAGTALYGEACDLADRPGARPAVISPRPPGRPRPWLSPRPRATALYLPPCLLRERERRVSVGDHQDGVRLYAQRPAHHPHHVVKEAAGVPAREEDGEPGDDHADNLANREEPENDVVGDGQEPLDQRHEPAQLLRVGVGEVQVHGLLFVGGGVLVAKQQGVRVHAGEEAREVEVPVEPPAGILPAEDQHEHDRPEEDRYSAQRHVVADARTPSARGPVGRDDQAGDDGDGDYP